MKYLKNKYVYFTLTKYLIYLLKFAQGVYIAVILGPYYFGLWGFITMVIEYLKYTTLGTQHSVNVELSTIDKTQVANNDIISRLIGNSLIVTLFFSLFIAIPTFIIYLLDINVGEKYELKNYLFLIILFTIFNNLSLVYTNIYRSYISLTKIILAELIFGIVPFLCIFIFNGKELIYALLLAMIFARIINVALFYFRFPFPIKLKFNIILAKKIIYVGFGLLIYNVSYNLAFLSTRTIVSIFYDVKEMGVFSFAYTITSAILLGINALTYVIYPKILFNLREDREIESTTIFMQKTSKIYGTIVSLTVLIVILLAPIIFYLFKEYDSVAGILNYLLVAQAIYSFSLIQATLSFARKKQYEVARFSLYLLFFLVLISVVLGYYQVQIDYIVLSILAYISVYSIWQTKFAYSILLKNSSYINSFRMILPIPILIPFSFVIIISFIGFPEWSGIGLLLFFLLNYRNIIFTYQEMILLIKSNK